MRWTKVDQPVFCSCYKAIEMADKDTSRARKRTCNKISDAQRSKLQEYYDRGMKTCGSDNIDRIGMAAEETGLTIDQVKVR